MDLFNDLPEPKNSNLIEEKHVGQKRQNEDDEDNEKSIKKQASSDLEQEKNNISNNSCKKILLKAFVSERKGERDSMQDRHVIIEDFSKFLKINIPDLKNISYYAIFDGHAGHRAAVYCAENMHLILAEKLSKSILNKNNLDQIEKEIKRHFVETFKQCDEEFLKLASKNKPSWKDGTTATVLLVLNNTLYVANIGDTKAIICKTKEENSDCDAIIELTKEHNASIYEERQRIQKSGGQVRDGRVLGVLEVSRSIGDGALKAYGVTCIPDVRKCQLNSSHKFVILGCDGLWSAFSNHEALKYLNDLKSNFIQDSSYLESKIYNEFCEKIAIDAVKKLTADNVTVMTISIKMNE